MSRRRGLLLALVLEGLAVGAAAHDFWIEPSSFHPAVGSEVAVSLRVGQNFQGEAVPRNPALIRKFAWIAGVRETPIDGLPGADPAGSFPVRAPGVLWIAYRSDRSPVALPADRFESYLAEEGLEGVLGIRKKRGEQNKPGREVFSRSVKSMLVAGAAPGNGFDRPLGLTLEIVLLGDPRRISPGGRLPVRLLYEGKPLEGALVAALGKSAVGRKSSVRTNARGEAALPLSQKDVWLLKAVHMTPAPPGLDADWESVWTSLTFEVP